MDWLCDVHRYIGQTVTIFTTSGGLSGGGFTGVLVSVNDCSVRLLVSAGNAPACAVGSSCGAPPNHNNSNFCGHALGAIVVIPICSIAAFTHNAI